MTVREAETRRRKRVRREALERAEREWVCGGPLADLGAPILGGGDAEHVLNVQREIARRTERLAVEANLLAMYHADRCTRGYPLSVRHAMKLRWWTMLLCVGSPHVVPTHSTHPALPTTTGKTIPRLDP